MTTAPTPSRADALIREHRASICPEVLPAWASDAVDELRRLQAAERTLHRLGYQDRGGQEWAPPIGKAPDFDLIDSLRSRIADLEAQLVAEARATAEHKLRADQLAKQHRMQAQMHARATTQLAEMEASKSARIHELEMQVLDLASENSILKRAEAEELEARKPLPCVVKLGPSQRGEKCSLGTAGCVVIHDDDERKPLPLSDDDRLRLRSDVARAIWGVMREHEDRCGHALEDVEPKHQVWDCADAAIKAVHGVTGGSS